MFDLCQRQKHWFKARQKTTLFLSQELISNTLLLVWKMLQSEKMWLIFTNILLALSHLTWLQYPHYKKSEVGYEISDYLINESN